MKLSIVSPIYYGEHTVQQLVERVSNACNQFELEFILVNDASPDNSWEVVKKLAQLDSRIKGINLSKNFGQHYAISAGLNFVSGDFCVVMDCDLQDRPEEIPNLLEQALIGYDVVLAQRINRQDSFRKRMGSKFFYKTLEILSGHRFDHTVANFGIYSKKVIDTINAMPEQYRYFPAMTQWVGFRQSRIEVQHDSREIGESTYNFYKLLKLALDIILNNSERPLTAVIILGLSVFIISFGIALLILVQRVLGIITVEGYTTLILSIWILGGLTISSLGIIALYISKIFNGIKQRPYFIIQEKTWQ